MMSNHSRNRNYTFVEMDNFLVNRIPHNHKMYFRKNELFSFSLYLSLSHCIYTSADLRRAYLANEGAPHIGKRRAATTLHAHLAFVSFYDYANRV
jgi:hypothetical protein